MPRSFLKYVSPGRIDILRNGMIRFTQTKYLNDPFELLPTITHLTADAFDPELIGAGTYDFTDEDYEFSCGRADYKETMSKQYREKSEALGILSLTGSAGMNDLPSVSTLHPTDPRMNLTMWAHYAASHSGFIIEFSPSFISDLEIKEVNYTKNRRVVTFEGVAAGDEGIYFEKSLHWNYENEWRAILPLSAHDDFIEAHDAYLYKFDKSKVRSVTLGCRMSPEDKQEIIGVLQSCEEYKDVKVFIARVSESEHRLEFSSEIRCGSSIWTNYMPGMESRYIDIQKKPKNTDGLVKYKDR